MNLELDEEQTLLVNAVAALGARWTDMPAGHERDYAWFAADLEEALRAGGFLRAGMDMDMLAAALVVIETARLPVATTAAASALVVPNLLNIALEGPVALLSGDLTKAQRLLPAARHALIDLGDDVALLDLEGVAVEPVFSIFAYPYGRFAEPVDLRGARRLGVNAVPLLRQWWRVALAAECAGAMASAVALTVDHVKERMVFGNPIGMFQAVQHRLAQCHQIERGLRLLVLNAAWSGDPLAANLAATYAQDHIGKLAFDLHQFNGGMGVTCEHKLHFWTYRMRALQAEVGGAGAAAGDAFDRIAESGWSGG